MAGTGDFFQWAFSSCFLITWAVVHVSARIDDCGFFDELFPMDYTIFHEGIQ